MEQENKEEMEKGKLPSEETEMSPAKAKQILKEGEIGGKPITEKQEGFLGAVAGKEENKKE